MTKFWVAVTTALTSAATPTTCCGVGDEGSPWRSLFTFETEDWMALVSDGKSLFADAASVCASVWTFWSCDCSCAGPPLESRVHVAEALDRLLEVTPVRAVLRLAGAAACRQRQGGDGRGQPDGSM